MSNKKQTFELNYHGDKVKLEVFARGKFRDGSIAVFCSDAETGKPYADLTSCIMSNRKFKENEGFLKCYGEHSFALEFVLENKIADFVLDENGNKIWENKGYCEFPLMAFDLEKINIIVEDKRLLQRGEEIPNLK